MVKAAHTPESNRCSGRLKAPRCSFPSTSPSNGGGRETELAPERSGSEAVAEGCTGHAAGTSMRVLVCKWLRARGVTRAARSRPEIRGWEEGGAFAEFRFAICEWRD